MHKSATHYSTAPGSIRHLVRRYRLSILAALPILCTGALAQEEAEVNLRSSIIGNQEQPKVLYIVPWQPVGDAELEDQTIRSQLEMVFGHVEQMELRRELNFQSLHAKKVEKSGGGK